ncbi:MAG: hypothetical protein JRH20_26575 [Deltaproteobacteria bacterium]|nr:hypothetical protein [Deltaproteobacteria bacterium]
MHPHLPPPRIACGAEDGCGSTCGVTSGCVGPEHRSSQGFGAPLGDARGMAAGADGDGNLYLLGQFTGSIDFGGGLLTSAGGRDLFAVSFSSAGVHRWSKSFGDVSAEFLSAGNVSTDGTITLFGSFEGSINFGGTTLTSAGSFDVFLAKLGSAGDHYWSKRFGSVGVETALRLVVGGENTTITASSISPANYGGGLLTPNPVGLFMANYGPSSAHRWSKVFNCRAGIQAGGIAVDPAGNVAMAGYVMGDTDLGGGPVTGVGGRDVFLASYTLDGVHRWSKYFATLAHEAGSDVGVDSDGNVSMTGYFNLPLNFGGGQVASSGGSDVFVASFTAAGMHRWSQNFGGAGSDSSGQVLVDSTGNLLISGSFSQSVNFGGGVFVAQTTSTSEHDMFLLGLTSDGIYRWSTFVRGDADELAPAFALAPDGSIVLTGGFTAPLDFGGGVLTPVGASDVYFVQLTPP